MRAELLELREIFNIYDRQGEDDPGTNRVTAQKLKAIINEYLHESVSREQLEEIIASVDLNESGDIQFNEFLKIMEKKSLFTYDPSQDAENAADAPENGESALNSAQNLNRDSLRAIFNAVDTDGDGAISFSELRTLLNSIGENGVSDADVLAMICLVDPKNKHGMISFNAFCRMMLTPDPDEA